MTAAPHVFRRILAVLDGEEGAEAQDRATVAAARRLAQRTGAALRLLSVVEPPRDLAALAQLAGVSETEAEARLIDTRRKTLSARAEGPSADDVAVRAGKIFLEVIREAIDWDADLVVKAAERSPGLIGGLFASTDQHLLRKCPCPVWLTGPGQGAAGAGEPLRVVAAAVDVEAAGDKDAAERMDGLNRRIVETAAAVAAADGATLHLIHAWEAPAEGLVRRFAPKDVDVIAYSDGVERQHRRSLTALRRTAEAHQGLARITNDLLRGPARRVVPAHALEIGADLLVMGTIARTGVPGFIIGNTAEDILNSVRCAVLTVKPPGYRSPVADAG
ncbi:MAG: universal stress protein [Marivibrio sp.]|uniref:universal stress protein n=1 Tax=Marivibrio sp. TaxID=2039719 RepID=UPI0032F037FF